MLISKENQRFVHHIDFYECPYSGDMKADALALEGAECGAEIPPDSIAYCYLGQQLFAWVTIFVSLAFLMTQYNNL